MNIENLRRVLAEAEEAQAETAETMAEFITKFVTTSQRLEVLRLLIGHLESHPGVAPACDNQQEGQ